MDERHRPSSKLDIYQQNWRWLPPFEVWDFRAKNPFWTFATTILYPIQILLSCLLYTWNILPAFNLWAIRYYLVKWSPTHFFPPRIHATLMKWGQGTCALTRALLKLHFIGKTAKIVMSLWLLPYWHVRAARIATFWPVSASDPGGSCNWNTYRIKTSMADLTVLPWNKTKI